jgi:uncharacterized lipoprotein YajG
MKIWANSERSNGMTHGLMTLRRLLLCVVPLLFASGCAFTSELIRIEPAASNAPAVPGAGSVGLWVVDLRSEQTQVVARKINGYGMQMATISNEEPLAGLVARAVSTELKARGYRVADDGEVPLLVELIVFSHEFRTGFFVGKSEATVTFLATVRDRAGRELFREVITGPFSHPVALAAGDNVRKAYEGALSLAAEKLVSSEAFQRAVVAAAAPPQL